MRVLLKGIHTVRRRLASGEVRVHRYAWRGGPRMLSEPGTPEFVAEYTEAHKARRAPRDAETVGGLVSLYKASSEFTGRGERTRHDYLRYLGMIEAEFGDMPLEALAEPGARGVFKEWRDGMAARPRKADLAWSVLARVFSVAKDRGHIAVNPCERGGRLYKADRRDSLWTDAGIAEAVAAFPKHLGWALMLAIWTGQRQGDLIRLPWSAYDGKTLRLRQAKTGRRVTIPAGAPLRAMLDGMKKRGPIILTTIEGTPWTSDGFRASWRRACARAGISGLTFHDLRGSAVTKLAEAGATEAEIASITGHSLRDVSAILDSHYLSRTAALAESGIRKLERKGRGTKSVNGPVNGSGNA